MVMKQTIGLVHPVHGSRLSDFRGGLGEGERETEEKTRTGTASQSRKTRLVEDSLELFGGLNITGNNLFDEVQGVLTPLE